jgi:hypothetical protein
MVDRRKRACSYCHKASAPLEAPPYSRGSKTFYPAYCDEYCQNLHASYRNRAQSNKNLRFRGVSYHGSDADDNGDNHNPSNDVEAMRDRLT